MHLQIDLQTPKHPYGGTLLSRQKLCSNPLWDIVFFHVFSCAIASPTI